MSSRTAPHVDPAMVGVTDRPGDPAAAPSRAAAEASRAEAVDLRTLALLLGPLTFVVLLIRHYELESPAFLSLAVISVCGFAVHYFLPLRLRLPFFLALSLFAFAVVLGIPQAAWLVALSLGVIGLAHLPVAFRYRIPLLLAAGAALMLARGGWIDAPVPAAIWPIFGAMFMFRLIVYLYDLRHQPALASRWGSLSYFFLLPNVCFPLFPVVDYKEFRRTYYNQERHRIYQVGVQWIFRGSYQLILYRLVYQHLVLDPASVVTVVDLGQYLLWPFLLYLRVSGQFHIIVGILHLFGFNLTETHRSYFLASSFTDFWRRINIYWKDFMMKIFYYPLFFRLRKYGDVPAIVAATMIVFILTWLLHSYQWFWLRGDFPLIWQDAVFWMGLALLVVVGAVREFKHGRSRTLGTSRESRGDMVKRGLRTVGVFLAICVLWSIWTSESIVHWTSIWSFLWQGIPDGGSPFPTLLVAVCVVIFAAAVLFGRETGAMQMLSLGRGFRLPRATLETVVLLAMIAPLGLPQVYTTLGANVANVVVSLKTGGLSRADAAALERGYYEGLTRVNRFNSQLWEVYMNRPTGGWLEISGSGLTRLRDDFLQSELARAFRSETKHGTIQTNSWGMRDQDYALAPGADTVRGLVLGYSTVMGWGVEQDETFEAVLEQRINRRLAEISDKRFELLNLSVPGYRPPQQAMALDEGLRFSPHLVFYTAAGREQWNTITFLADVLAKGVEIPYPGLKALLAEAGVGPGMAEPEILQRLKAHDEALLAWVYDWIAQGCAAQGIRPVWIYLPPLFPTAGEPEERGRARELAQAAGFEVIDLTGVYDGRVPESLSLQEWDRHPNAEAHAMIANALYEAMERRPASFGLPGL